MRVAIVVDKKGWIQHDRAKILKRLMPFDIRIYTPKQNIPFKEFDVIYFSNITLVDKFAKCPVAAVGSVTSHKTLNHPRLSNFVKRCNRISANSKIIHESLLARNYKSTYIPNGVDTSFFTYSNRRFSPSNYSVGWVGNKDRETKNYPIVQRLKKRFSIRDVATSKGQGKKLSPKKMLAYYHWIDFFLVVSSTEGTPNPALEAASCGIPVLTTKVGNMPELVSDSTGAFLDDNYESATRLIEKMIQITPDKHDSYKRNIRKEAEKWDWNNRVDLYREFLSAF